MATITTRAGKGAALTHQEVDANFTGLNTELGQKEVASNKGIANGYASLDSAGKVPSAQLPSYVDDVVEVANFASLPGTGETGKIYVTIDTNKTYRWTGSTYIEISASPGSTDSLAEGSTNLYFTQARARSSISASGSLSYNSSTGVMSFTDAVTSVAGRSGAVTLTSSDVGLGNVENKSSATIRGEITSSNVTTALGFTPYNATNPSGYITSSALSSYLPLSGGTLTGTLTVGADGGGANFVQRAVNGWQDVLTVWRGGSNVWNLQDSSGSAKVTSGSFFIGSNLALHAGNYTSYSPSLTGSGASGTWSINVTGTAGSTPALTGAGYGVDRFTWHQESGTFAGQSGWASYMINNHGNGSNYYNQTIIMPFWGAPQYSRLEGGTFRGPFTFITTENYNNYSYAKLQATRYANTDFNNLGNEANGFRAYSNYIPSGGSYNQPPNGAGDYRVYQLSSPETAGNWGGQIVQNFYDDRMWFRRQQGAAWQSWREFIHDGNYTSYSPSLTGSGASGTWGINVTGNAATATSATSADQIDSWGFRNTGSNSAVNADTIESNGISYYNAGVANFSGNSSDGALYSQMYSSSWQHQIAGDYRSGQIALRGKNSGTWQSWRTVLDSANYTSYSPSLTGSGASGTWGINVTGYSAYLPTSYAGGQQLNPQTYFNMGIGLKVSMTAAAGYWSDTLWINGYAGGDVLSMCALHTSRQGTPRMWISTQASNATSYGALYEIISSYNYTSFSPSLTGSGASGTWGINISGSAAQLNGYASSESGGGNVVLRTSSNGYLYLNNWINTASGGLFSGVNGAHWYPNNGSYGAWKADGSRNGWGGIEFPGSTTAVSLMIEPNGDTVGFHAHSYGWKFRVAGGTAYVGKNYWGANEATILDSSNYTNYSPSFSSGGTFTGLWYFRSNRNTSSDSAPLQAFSNDGGGAIMSFHRGGYYATNFGLDSDNVIRIGGWSAATNRLQMDMSGNLTMAGNVTAYSDERLKKDWSPIYDGFVDRLAVIRAGTYTRIDSGERQAGVSAQAMRELLPEVVSEDNDGTLALAYGNAAMVSAIELAKKVVALENKVAELRARIH